MNCEACGHSPGDPLPPRVLLRQAREKRGWTQENVLSAAGSDRDVSWLSRFEISGKRIPVWAEWEALCRAVGIDPTKTAAGRKP